MPPPDSQTNHEPSDPRLLLPKWLRDQEEAPAPPQLMAQAGPAIVEVAQSEPPLETAGDQGVDPHEERTRDASTSNRWQLPPPPPSGTYDPSTMISFDDLPLWVQRLRENAVGTASVNTVAQAPGLELPSKPTTRSSAVSEPIFGEAAEPDRASGALIEEPTEALLMPESDLSLTRFFWIAGTALVLIVASLLVLFG